MRGVQVLIFLAVVSVGSSARGNLCNEAEKDKISSESKNEASFYSGLFTDPTYQGNSGWNATILECNRKRDSNGTELRNIMSRDDLKDLKDVFSKPDLKRVFVEGHYSFFGIAGFKYRYFLKKQNGVWEMIVPYDPEVKDAVKDRIDIYVGDKAKGTTTYGSDDDNRAARNLWEVSQFTESVSGGVTTLTPKSDAKPIADTLCTKTTFFEGKEKKYEGQNDLNSKKRDRENKFIDLGIIQYSYDDNSWEEGCRVRKNVDLVWKNRKTGVYEKIRPDKWVMRNFVAAAEGYWSIPNVFTLRILMRGLNEDEFADLDIKNMKNSDFLKTQFGSLFMPSKGFDHANQMYMKNVWQPNNFSTMTTDGGYWHEVGHTLGLDDEYGGTDSDGKPKRSGCDHADFKAKDSQNYQMCNSGTSSKRTIYHYIAVSRYAVTQICKKDDDCDPGQFCNNKLGVNRCLADGTLKVGESCFKNRECKSNRCEDKTCVCKNDLDCGKKKCKKVAFGKNRCE